MKSLLRLVPLLVIAITTRGQANQIVAKEIYNIREIPAWYNKRDVSSSGVQQNNLIKDSAWLKIIRLDTAAIPLLIPFLTDTTTTTLRCGCLPSTCTMADIAFFLINDIEMVPCRLVTGVQYCLPGECATLPYGFLQGFSANRFRLQDSYTRYYYGSERAQWLKSLYGRGKKSR